MKIQFHLGHFTEVNWILDATILSKKGKKNIKINITDFLLCWKKKDYETIVAVTKHYASVFNQILYAIYSFMQRIKMFYTVRCLVLIKFDRLLMSFVFSIQ